MQLPLAIFLLPYGIFLLAFGIFSLVDVVHLVKYRSSDFTAFVLTFIYLSGAALLLYATWYFLVDVNWNEQFTLFQSFSFTPQLDF